MACWERLIHRCFLKDLWELFSLLSLKTVIVLRSAVRLLWTISKLLNRWIMIFMESILLLQLQEELLYLSLILSKLFLTAHLLVGKLFTIVSQQSTLSGFLHN